jgi:hypothetical protein
MLLHIPRRTNFDENNDVNFRMDNMLLSVVVSTLVTGLIQSSGATMSILLSLASQVMMRGAAFAQNFKTHFITPYKKQRMRCASSMHALVLILVLADTCAFSKY